MLIMNKQEVKIGDVLDEQNQKLREKKYNKYVETAFLNSKYLNTIDEITIKKNKDEFSLLKKNNVWIGKKYNNEFPVEQKLVEKSLNNLIKIRKMYKISDNINNLEKIGNTFNISANAIAKQPTYIPENTPNITIPT